MKFLRISSMTLRITFLLAIILGISFWAGWIAPSPGLRGIHMLIGILFVLSLWGIGVAEIFLLARKNLPLGITLVVVGIAVVIVGLNQDQWRASVGLELMNTIHLVLNILAISLGEIAVARAQRLAKTRVVTL